MKKKIIAAILCVATLTCGAVALSACSGKDKVKEEVDTETYAVYSDYVAYNESISQTPLSYENWLSSMEEILDYYLLDNGTYAVGIGMARYLSSIVIPSTHNGKAVTEIARFGFGSLDGGAISVNLETVIIPDSITTIGEYAFRGCESLRSVKIPESVTKIGGAAFYECYNAILYCEAKEQPAGWSSGWNYNGEYNRATIWDCKNNDKDENGYAYYSADGIMYALKDGEASVKNVSGKLINVNISANITYNGSVYNVTSVEKMSLGAYYSPNLLESATIPASVTSIGSSAFNDCDKLESITVAENNAIFASQSGILCNKEKTDIILVPRAIKGEITIPDGVTSIGNNAFQYRSSLESVTIPNSVTSIGSEAFYGCSSLESVTIPNSVTSIGSEAFYGCSSLESVTIPSGVTSIGDYAFGGCNKLESITVAENNATFASQGGILYNKEKTDIIYVPYAIKGVITIPAGVTSIGNNTFYNCRSLTSVIIPNSVTSIGSSAFNGCDKLESITVAEDNLVYASQGEILYNKGKTDIIYVPHAIKGEITIPDGVMSIGNNAFYMYSSLTSVTIPNSVTSIRYEAFAGCSSLTSITFKGTKEQWNAIEKSYGWNYKTGNYIVHCTDGDIGKSE